MKLQPIISILLVLGLISACTSTTTVAPNDTGMFQGNVALVDARGDTLSNYTGVTVRIEGTSFQATSNAAGDWGIAGVPAGIYNILLTKPGFDTLIIPQYQFRGAGTSFVMSTGIQAYPLDSLVFTITNTIEDSTATSYLGLMGMVGGVSGPDSAVLVQGLMVASGGITQSPTVYLTNGQISNLNKGAIGYNVPPVPHGAIVRVQSYLYALSPKMKFTYFQPATSPYIVERTITLP